MEILTARPKGMDFETYREKRKESNAMLKNYLHGRLCFLSAWLVNIGSDRVPKWAKSEAKYNRTFRGNTKKLMPI